MNAGMESSQSISPALRLALSVLVMGATLMQVLDTTIANVALPHMQAALGASRETVAWVLTSYILAAAVATPTIGWLENWMGRRMLFTVSIGGFTVASALCGAAPTLEAMVAARVLQGLFGALLMPLSQAVMLDIYPLEKRSQAITVWSMVVMIGPISGPFIGGLITDNMSWRWVFYVNVPFGILCTLALWILLAPGKSPSRRFDAFGFGLLAIALASFQLMLDRGTQLDWFDSNEIIIEACLAAGAMWMFVIHTLTAPAPLIPRALFRDRNFVNNSMLTIVISGIIFSSQALMAPMLQQLLHYNAEGAGVLMMPRGAGSMVGMLIGSRLSSRMDPRIVMIGGLVVLSFGQLMMSEFDLVMGAQTIIVSSLIQGFGVGLVAIPMTVLAFSTLPASLRTDGAGLFSLVRNLAGSVGIAVASAMVARNVQVNHSELAEHVTSQTVPIIDPAITSGMGHAGQAVASLIDVEVNRQALMIAYINDFRAMMWAALLVMPLVIWFRPSRQDKGGAPVPE